MDCTQLKEGNIGPEVSSISVRRLDEGRFYKPLDFGNGLLTGSVAPDGRLLSLNTYHPVHGYVTLSASAPFPQDRRHDPAAVRAYRASLAQRDAPSFGLRLLAETSAPETYLLADVVPHSRFQVTPDPDQNAGLPLSVDVTTWAPRPHGESMPAALQVWRFHNPTGQPASVDCVWDRPVALNRASYTQLTESGDLPTLTPRQELAFDGDELVIMAPGVGAATVRGLPAGPPWQRSGPEPLQPTARGRLTVPAQETADLTLIYAVGQTAEQARAAASSLEGLDVRESLATTLGTHEQRWATLDPDIADDLRLLAHRALAYVLDCCAVPVAEGICLLTDHQILPLSWTRDAYFVVQGLRAADESRALEVMRRHLLWLFETAQRPDGYWGRAYLANGRPKDRIFQLDQQCYPLLELAEYAVAIGDEATVSRLLPHLPAILDVILSQRAPHVPLFATEETPADDPMPLPYHFSSQVLLWHTFRQLAVLNSRWSFTSLDLDGLTNGVRTAIWDHLTAEHAGRRVFAYAADLQGNFHFYHDANDLPAVLASVWGFCTTDDPTWRATLEFAFSPANEAGYYPGPVGGLGSVHTPGPWPLGDVQELLFARLTSDAARARAVLDRLATTAGWDGSLPEARDEESGAVRSRHWFAWPGAALLATLSHPAWQP